MDVDVVVRGDRETVALLERLTRRLQDGRPQLLRLVDLLLAVERERFAGRGTRWRKLRPSTIREHAHHGRGPQPLILTGLLMRSLTVRGAPEQRVEVHPSLLRFGTRVYYALFQKKTRRNPVGFTRAQKKSVVAELRSLLVEDL